MSNLFANLQQTSEAQKKQIEALSSPDNNQTTPLPMKEKKATSQSKTKIANKNAQQNRSSTQISKTLSKKISKDLSTNLSRKTFKDVKTENVEDLAYRLRRIPKARINGDVPDEWKQKLDEIALKLKVKKYDLVLYIIGEFLEEV